MSVIGYVLRCSQRLRCRANRIRPLWRYEYSLEPDINSGLRFGQLACLRSEAYEVGIATSMFLVEVVSEDVATYVTSVCVLSGRLHLGIAVVGVVSGNFPWKVASAWSGSRSLIQLDVLKSP